MIAVYIFSLISGIFFFAVIAFGDVEAGVLDDLTGEAQINGDWADVIGVVSSLCVIVTSLAAILK